MVVCSTFKDMISLKLIRFNILIQSFRAYSGNRNFLLKYKLQLDFLASWLTAFKSVSES